MAGLGMGDMHDYDSLTIRYKVLEERIGNFALGYSSDKGVFCPKYVGRSDSDLKVELQNHLQDKNHHSKFKFRYAESVTDAFHIECNHFHDFKNSLENEIHPDSPNGMYLTCPKCDHGTSLF